MADGKTNHLGEFELRGCIFFSFSQFSEKSGTLNRELSTFSYTEEFTPIDPKLNIYHDCNDGLTVSLFAPKWHFKSSCSPASASSPFSFPTRTSLLARTRAR